MVFHIKDLFKPGSRHQERESLYTVVRISLPLVIHFLARFSLIWEVILYVTAALSYVLITYAAFFSYYDAAIWDFVFFNDVIFLIDVLLRLCVEEWRFLSQTQVVVFSSTA